MTTHSLPSPVQTVPQFTLPLWLPGGLAAAVADLALAAAYWSQHGSTAQRVLQSISAWVMGPPAYQGGWESAMLGFLLYAGTMCAVMALYQLLSRRFDVLLRRPVVCGALYGVLMYVLIFHLLVPHFSAAVTRRPLPLQWEVLCVAAYIGLIGIPCALLARVRMTSRR